MYGNSSAAYPTRLGKSIRVFDQCTSLFLFAVDDNHVNDEQSD